MFSKIVLAIVMFLDGDVPKESAQVGIFLNKMFPKRVCIARMFSDENVPKESMCNRDVPR